MHMIRRKPIYVCWQNNERNRNEHRRRACDGGKVRENSSGDSAKMNVVSSTLGPRSTVDIFPLRAFPPCSNTLGEAENRTKDKEFAKRPSEANRETEQRSTCHSD